MPPGTKNVPTTPPKTVSSQRVYARHSLGGTWWLGLLLIPLVVALLLTVLRHGAMQDDLRAESLKALDARGIHGVTVTFNGRTATIGIPIWLDQNAARTTVENVDGVSSVLVGTLDANNPYTPSDCAKPQAVLKDIGSSSIALTGLSKMPAASVSKMRSVAQLINACDQLRVAVGGAQPSYLKRVLVDYHIEANRIVARPSSGTAGTVRAVKGDRP
ncbi:MAG: hypothetical protein JWR35_526 [Marmoricola sp.]|nr:hypothetical protein [Marmoricola sp.]